MNTSIKSISVGIVIGVVATVFAVNFGENQARAQGGIPHERYLCLPLPDTIKAGDFAAKLDALGQQGWKVRCSIGATLILAQ